MLLNIFMSTPSNTNFLKYSIASLPEKKIRDLNDEINKSLREKARWERRILDLGGPNYFVRKF